jgi:hypothetical protein
MIAVAQVCRHFGEHFDENIRSMKSAKGGQEAADITLTPTTSCSSPGLGHILSKLLNRGVPAARLQKAATPATFPPLARCTQTPPIFTSHGDDSFKVKRRRSSALMLGSGSRPV